MKPVHVGIDIAKESLQIADEMIISLMKIEVEGDTYFPKFTSEEWELFLTSTNEDFDVNYFRRKN